MKNTRARLSSRLIGVTSLAAVMLLGCGQGLLAAPSGQPSKDEILKAAPGDFDYLFLNKYPVYPSPLVEKFDIEGKIPTQDAYSRRTVTWWPRKWVDYIPEDEIPKAAIKRTWTFRSKPGAGASLMDSTWRLVDSEIIGDGTFDAHLIGYRALGSDKGADKSKAPDEFIGYGSAPTLLRLPDGRLRLFTQGMLSNDDQEFIMELYNEQMARLRKNTTVLKNRKAPLDHLNHKGQPQYRPASEVLGKPGRMYIESEHFAVFSGSQSPPGLGGIWVNDLDPESAARYRAMIFDNLENFWSLYEYVGHHLYGWDYEHPNKYWILVPGTYYDGKFTMPGNYSGGVGGCGIRGAYPAAFYHEWGHGARSGFDYGGGEAIADVNQMLNDPTQTMKMEHQFQRPLMNIFHGWYPATGGQYTLGEDPNWGYYAPVVVGPMVNKTSPMHAYAKVAFERGLWDDPIVQFGDFIASIFTRWAEIDTQSELQIKKNFVAVPRSYLTCIDSDKRIYRSAATQAPHAYGVHISRLVPDKGAKEITADFEGIFDKDTFSDWRACIIAVDGNGVSRYSPMWNKGKMTVKVQPGDRRFWLTVTATPFAIAGNVSEYTRTMNKIYEQNHAYTYPFEVTLENCTAGSPHTNIAENRNYQLTYPAQGNKAIEGANVGSLCDWPVLPDHPDYEKTINNLVEVKKRLPAAQENITKLARERKCHPFGWREIFMLPYPGLKNYRADYVLRNSLGVRHKNGGGWVSADSKVADTAYVAPNAMVLDGAQVLDNASIEDYAIVTGPEVVIKDNAKVLGKAIIAGNVQLNGFARVFRNIINREARIQMNTEEFEDRPAYLFMVRGANAPVVRTGPELRQKYRFLATNLQANYGMLVPETVLLEDTFTHHDKGPVDYTFWDVAYDGQLFGKPSFFMDKEAKIEGFSFDGKKQYAELESTVLDLGEATINFSVRFKGSAGVLLDAGHNKDNRFVLSVDKSGKPTLAVTVKGKTTKATGKKALQKDAWSDVRLEMSGTVSQVFVDNALSVKVKKAFRPSDVIPNGSTRRNYLAIDREKKNPLAVDVDYVQVYYKVYNDFAKEALIAPTLSPRRLSGDLDWLDEKIDRYNEEGQEQYEDLAKTGLLDSGLTLSGMTVDEIRAEMKRLLGINEKIRASMETSPEIEALKKKVDELTAKKTEATAAAKAAYKELDSTKALRVKIEGFNSKRRELQDEIKAEPKIAAINKELAELRKQQGELRKKIETEAKTTADYLRLQARFTKMSDRFKLLDEKVKARIDADTEFQEALAKLGDPKVKLDRKERDQLNRRVRELERKYQGSVSGWSRWKSKRDQAKRVFREYPQTVSRAHPEVGALDGKISQLSEHFHELYDAHPLQKEIQAIPRIDIRKSETEYVEEQTAAVTKQIEEAQAKVEAAVQARIDSINPEEYAVKIGGLDKWFQINVFGGRGKVGGFVTSESVDYDVAALQDPAQWTSTITWNGGHAGSRKPYESTTPRSRQWMEEVMPYRYGPNKGKKPKNTSPVISHVGSLPTALPVKVAKSTATPEELKKKVLAALAMDMGDLPLNPPHGQRSYEPSSVKSDSVENLKALTAEKWVVPTGNISMVKIPAGEFTMGSPATEVGRGEDEAQVNVTISKPFYMGVVEVTQNQYIKLRLPNFTQHGYKKGAWGYSPGELYQGGPSYNAGRLIADSSVLAMESVNWYKAMEFCKKINEAERKAGRLPKGYEYRLPTEAEWEYACRAGTKGEFNREDKEITDFATVVYNRMWIGKPERVGWRLPNAWGLYDMHGGVYEWCLDAYGPYSKKAVRDPLNKAEKPDLMTRRVARGGSFESAHRGGRETHLLKEDVAERNRYIRSASRNHFVADGISPIVGFRVVLAPEVKKRN